MLYITFRIFQEGKLNKNLDIKNDGSSDCDGLNLDEIASSTWILC